MTQVFESNCTTNTMPATVSAASRKTIVMAVNGLIDVATIPDRR